MMKMIISEYAGKIANEGKPFRDVCRKSVCKDYLLSVFQVLCVNKIEWYNR